MFVGVDHQAILLAFLHDIGELGLVQTSDFSCADSNVFIYCMKSSTFESICCSKNLLISTVVLFDRASRIKRLKFDIDSNVELLMCRI